MCEGLFEQAPSLRKRVSVVTMLMDELTRPDTHSPIFASGNCAAAIWKSGNGVNEGSVTRKSADGRRVIEGVDIDIAR